MKCMHKATRMVKGFKKLPYESRLRKMGIYSLDRRRLRGDLIETFKIITEKTCELEKMFSAVTSGLRTFIETVQAKMQYNNQTEFLFVTCHQWIKLQQEVVDAPTITSFTNRLDRHWRDIWAFSADRLYSPSTSSTINPLPCRQILTKLIPCTLGRCRYCRIPISFQHYITDAFIPISDHKQSSSEFGKPQSHDHVTKLP